MQLPLRRASRLAGICAGLSIFAPGLAEAAEVPSLAVEQFQLENGLHVILHPDPRLPVVAVNVWYDVGALHEKAKKTGFAHLFEHMMFQGSRHVPEDAHFAILEGLGATDINGSTENDRTNYFATVPKNQLETALWLESDRMGFLLDHVNEASFRNQVEVVKNERRQSVEQRPYGLFEEKRVQTLFPPTHPYFGAVIGSMDDLDHATVDDVRAFFQAYYTPANASLALVGDLDVPAAKALVQKYFGTLKGRPKPPLPEVSPPVLHGQTVVQHQEAVGKLSQVTVAWVIPGPFSPGSWELQLLADVISGTRASRLDAKAVHTDRVAQAATVSIEQFRAGSTFELSLTMLPGHTAEEGLAEIDAVLADLKKHPPTAAELLRAKNARVTHTLLRLESAQGRAELFQRYFLYLGDANKLGWDLEHTLAVTLPDLRAAAERTFTGDRLVGLANVGAPGAK
ncbi:MAG: pitrilysin family protein [Myxococcota bacterium]